MNRKRWLWIACLGGLGLVVAGVGWAMVTADHAPGSLIRYTMRRLQGHNKLEAVALPVLHVVQARFERPVPTYLPDLGKGQRPLTLNPGKARADVVVDSIPALALAMQQARAGQVIELAPGQYRLTQRLNTGQAASAQFPIIVRAAMPGQVNIAVEAEVAIRVSQPGWVFENLDLQGVCKEDSACEHAFHVTGPAQHTVIRNNRLIDFNAAIKINGVNKQWPDAGEIRYNTLGFTHPRNTHLPVTPIDLVGASRWVVADNHISGFVKTDGNRISYGVFMKGAGRDGRIERNLIICTPTDISQPGERVGLSFGGGGTGKGFCRDQGRCEAEHVGGVAANNIIAHCNDHGLDINKADQTVFAFNTLINTAGIQLRGGPEGTRIYGNLLEGRIRHAASDRVDAQMNEQSSLSRWFADPDAFSFHWRRGIDTIPSLPALGNDFCNRPRRDGTLPGAIDSEEGCSRP